MATGKVKWFNGQKGYGFIQPDTGGKDVFVHAKDLEKGGIKNVQQDDRLSYDLGESRGKTNAINIRRA